MTATLTVLFRVGARKAGTSWLADVLAIAPQRAETGTALFKRQLLKLDKERGAKALDLLRPRYDYVAARFGGMVPDRWLAGMADVS